MLLLLFHSSGRFFSTTLAAEAVSVINVKTSQRSDCPRSYQISDGLYGLLSSARFDPFVNYLPKLLEVSIVTLEMRTQ